MPQAAKKGLDPAQMLNELGSVAADLAEGARVSTPQGEKLSVSRGLMILGNIGGVRDQMRKAREQAAIEQAEQLRGLVIGNKLGELQLSEAEREAKQRREMAAGKGTMVTALQALPGTGAELDAAIAGLQPEQLAELVGKSAEGAVGIGTRQAEAAINAPSMADLKKQAEFFRTPAGELALERNPRLAAVVGQVLPVIEGSTFLAPSRRGEIAENLINATAGVMRQEQSDITSTTRAKMEGEVFNSSLIIESLAEMGQLANEDMFTYLGKITAGGQNFIDRADPVEYNAFLDAMEQLRSISSKSLSEYGKSISGGAIANEEMERLRQAWPDFERDGFNRFHSKRKAMQRSMESRRRLALRWAAGEMSVETVKEIESRVARQLANEFELIDSDQSPAPNHPTRALKVPEEMTDAELDEEMRRLGVTLD